MNDTIYTLVGDMKQAPWVGNPHHRLVDSGQILFDRAKHAEVSTKRFGGGGRVLGRMAATVTTRTARAVYKQAWFI